MGIDEAGRGPVINIAYYLIIFHFRFIDYNKKYKLPVIFLILF